MGETIIVDYNVGNICSVENALRRLGATYCLSGDPARILSADHVILPGVGNAAEAMRRLREKGLVEVIKAVKAPLLGICVGMQLMCNSSQEGNTACMGLFDVEVKRFPDGLKGEDGSRLKIPHMGWSRVSALKSPLFEGLSLLCALLLCRGVAACCSKDRVWCYNKQRPLERELFWHSVSSRKEW